MINAAITPASAGSTADNTTSTANERADAERPAQSAPADDSQAAVVTISAAGAQRAQASEATTAATADVATAAAAGSASTATPAAQSGTQAAPPTTTQSATPSGTQTGTQTGTLSSATKLFEPADIDQDGTVTPKEQAAYDAKLATDKADKAAADERNTPEADAAVKEYVAVEQMGQAGGSAAA